MEQNARAKSMEELRHELRALGVVTPPVVTTTVEGATAPQAAAAPTAAQGAEGGSAGATLDPEPTVLVQRAEGMRPGQATSEVVAAPGHSPLDDEHVGLVWQLVDAQQQRIRDEKKSRNDTKAAEDTRAAEERKARQEAQRSKLLQLMRMSDADAAATDVAADALAEKERELHKVEVLLHKLNSARRSFDMGSADAEVSGDMPPVDATDLLVALRHTPAAGQPMLAAWLAGWLWP